MAGSISTLGVGSGLQLQDILDKLRAIDQQVVDRKKTSITKYESQVEEFTVVKNKLLTVKSAALNLSLASTFLGRTVTSSAEDTATATAGDGATVKSTQLAITNLAQKSSWMSSVGVASGDSDITGGVAHQLTFALGDGESSTTVTVPAGTTLTQLADTINEDSANSGVTAAIVNDGLDPEKPYKLALTAASYGEDHRITILSQLPDLPLAELANQSAANSLNSQFTVDGIAYQRQTNTVNDVLSGVTINLQSAGTSTITVANNDDALKESITSLVTAYNDVVQEVRGKSGYDTETGSFGILANTTLRDMPFDLQGLMTSSNLADPDRNITSLFALGMEFNRDGTISIDDTVLSQTISNHADGISAFFLGDSDNNIEGLADSINNRLRTMTSSTGLVEGEKNAAQARIDELTLKLSEENARLDKKYEQMTKQFIALDSYMNEMTSMSNFLTGQFNSLKDGWVNSSTNNN